MKFSLAAVLAVAAGVQAWSNVTVVTEVVTAVTTYCPEATEITYGGSTYTVTEATTLTITDCPCTVTKSLTTISSVACQTCGGYTNATTAAPTKTLGTVTSSKPTSTAIATAGAGKGVAVSGAGLVGILGLAAFFL